MARTGDPDSISCRPSCRRCARPTSRAWPRLLRWSSSDFRAPSRSRRVAAPQLAQPISSFRGKKKALSALGVAAQSQGEEARRRQRRDERTKAQVGPASGRRRCKGGQGRRGRCRSGGRCARSRCSVARLETEGTDAAAIAARIAAQYGGATGSPSRADGPKYERDKRMFHPLYRRARAHADCLQPSSTTRTSSRTSTSTMLGIVIS